MKPFKIALLSWVRNPKYLSIIQKDEKNNELKPLAILTV